MNENKYEYTKDFISLTLIENKNTNKINDELLPDLIKSNIRKIIEEIILSGQYDILSVLIKYFKIDNEIMINNLLTIQYSSYRFYVKFETIEWIYKNDLELFKVYIDKLFQNNNLNLLNIYCNYYKIINFFDEIIIKSNNDYSLKYKSIFINSIYKFTCSNNLYYSMSNVEINKNVYSNLEHVILLTDISLQEYNLDKKIHLFKIIDRMFTNEYSNLKIIKSFINHYNLSQKELKLHLENKDYNFINNLIQSKNFDKINWFFDNIQDYTKFIRSSNYLNIFRTACRTSKVEIAKYVYNLISLCGFKISNADIAGILDSIIYSSRWNKTKDNDQIICELINLGVKPSRGYPKYTEYYNNFKIINK